MAMSGGTAYKVKSTTTPGWEISLYVYVKVVSQSTASNSSVLSLGMYVYSKYDIGPWGDYNGSYLGVDGSNQSFNGAIANGTGTRWIVENLNFTVYHNNDGSKSVTIGWHWGVNSSWGGYVNPSGTFGYTLPKIDRYPSAPTSCTAKVGTDSVNYSNGDTVTISWSGASGVITGYEIQYATRDQNSGAWSGWNAWQSTSSTSITDTWGNSWLAGVQFKYRVRAMNGSLPSSYKKSNVMTIRGGLRRNCSGTWKHGTAWIKISGTWKRAKCVWIKIGGTWYRST